MTILRSSLISTILLILLINKSLTESINSEKNINSDVISDLSDLPTKFGDEDDVINVKPEKSKNAGHFDATGGDILETGDEEYDDEDDDSHHYPDKLDSDYKNSEYDESELGPTLDNFGGKLDGGETSESLPIFLTEPQSSFVVRNRPAILKCKAAYALEINFKCSGSSQPPPSTHEPHVDPHSGVHLQEVTATISRDLVDEFFGKGPFKCECYAWSPRGKAKSQSATVEVACKYIFFFFIPQTL